MPLLTNGMDTGEMNIDHLVLLCLITKHTICLQRTNSTKRSVIYGKQIWCSMRGHEKHKKHIYIYRYRDTRIMFCQYKPTYIYILLYTINTCVFGILWTFYIYQQYPTIVGILPQWDGHIVKLCHFNCSARADASTLMSPAKWEHQQVLYPL